MHAGQNVMKDSDFLDLGISALGGLMKDDRLSAVELLFFCLNRICVYDRRGPVLNAVPVLNPRMFKEAEALDAERRAGHIRGPLHGIPVVVKDSFKVMGLTVAAGSPAFADLVASEDAASVARLREAGALIVGKTNTPPMAIGGGQRSLYGKTSSPYNPDYLAAAWHSGSSIGSGVAVAAGFAPIALAEETVSSGRSPASNNGLCAYTPSRATISIRGNWPLFALRDTVVPYARSLSDLALVIGEVIKRDPVTAGDLWRDQDHVAIAGGSVAWPKGPVEALCPGGLRGRRIGIPKMYIGCDAGLRTPIPIRKSILALWKRAEARLLSLGAEVVHVDFPVVSEYEGDRDGARTLAGNGYVPPDWDATEIGDLVASCWKQFLLLNGDRQAITLEDTPPAMIHPDPPDAVDTRRRASAYEGRDEFRYDRIVDFARTSSGRPLEEFPQLAGIMSGLERARRELFEDWLAREGIDFVAFPANCDISRSDAETDKQSSAQAWTNGTVFSNMNHVMRHLGIPSFSVPMGRMEDTAMPVNITFCGPDGSDFALLHAAFDFEQAGVPPMSPVSLSPLAVESNWFRCEPSEGCGPVEMELHAHAVLNANGSVTVYARAKAIAAEGDVTLGLFVDGAHQKVGTNTLEVDVTLSRSQRGRDFRCLVSVLAYAGDGTVAARYIEVPYRAPGETPSAQDPKSDGRAASR